MVAGRSSNPTRISGLPLVSSINVVSLTKAKGSECFIVSRAVAAKMRSMVYKGDATLFTLAVLPIV